MGYKLEPEKTTIPPNNVYVERFLHTIEEWKSLKRIKHLMIRRI